MSTISIETWLKSGKVYSIGLSLFLPHCKNQSLLKELSKGPDAYNKIRLEKELRKLIRKSINEEEKVIITTPSSLKKVNPPIESREATAAFPKELLSVRKRRKDRYATMGHLHASLSHCTSDEERKTIAEEVLNLDEQIDESWGVEDHFKETGQLPTIEFGEQKKELPNDPLKLTRLLFNAKSNISKAKKKLEKARLTGDESEIASKEAMLNRHLENKRIIEQQLGNNDQR